MKRIMDILISVIAVIFFSWLFIIVGILIKITSKGPIVFKQDRIGKDNKIFKIYKFRTMKVGTPNVAPNKIKDAEVYLTKVGCFLRKTSLDELPQLINIIKGDMAFVGPRPCLYNEYELTELRTKAGVHTLVPGMTGWAQINGRDYNDNEQKTKLDRYYLENKSIVLDLKIIFLTFFKVITGEGVVEGGNSNIYKIKHEKITNNDETMRI